MSFFYDINTYMKMIQFLGAAGMVTGSSYLFSDDRGTSILVDMGMFQGTTQETQWNHTPLAFDPSTLTAVILTHAHLDHCGKLPILAKRGFLGRIYMTHATRQLLEITLYDAVKVAKMESKRTQLPPLYDEIHVAGILSLAVTVEYHESFDIGRYTGQLLDAGHILGSASVALTDKSGVDAVRTIVFSGDLGNTPQDLIQPTEYIPEADAVVMESTYGDRAHPDDSPEKILSEEIARIENSGGALLIPAFSIERMQVLLHMIGHLKDDGLVKRRLAVFLDSPMGGKITDVYRKFPQLYSEELAQHVQRGDPFDFPGLSVTETHRESLKIRKHKGPKVIIAGSGMMSGGRIVDHARNFLPQKNTRLLFVGYQGEETLGRQIEDGARRVTIYGKPIDITASVRTLYGLSAHADQPRLLHWLQHIQGVKTVFLTHGDDGPRSVLADTIRSDLTIPLVVQPQMNEAFHLDLLPTDAISVKTSK